MSGDRLLFLADRIRTASGIVGDALLVERGQVVAVGDHSTLAAPGVVEVDYRGAVITPGLRDAHFHPVSYAAALGGVSLKTAADLSEVIDRLRLAATALRPGEPMVAVRLDDEGLAERRLPTRIDLDSTFPDRPVLLHRYCGHVAVANSAALRAAHVDEGTADPEGGIVDRDPTGRPTGVLRETAIELVSTRLQGARSVGADQLVDAMGRLAGLGLTSLGAIVGCGDGPWATLGDETEVLAAAGPRLPIRLHALVIAGSAEQLDARAAALTGLGPNLGWLGLKRFADGSLGGHTAAMHAPYHDRPEATGTMRLTAADADLARHTLAAGGAVAVHAIGDRACGAVLDLFSDLIADGARPDRLRLEHASVLSSRDIARAADLGIIVSVQPAFLGSETTWLEHRVGADRIPLTYPFRSLLDAGARLAGGSDCPVEPPDPLAGMALARDRAGIHPAEGLSGDEALALFTDGAARSLGEPPPLVPGSPADLVVLDVDPVDASPDDLRRAVVVDTFVAGTRVEVPDDRTVWPG